jgi:hypothetical protein
MVPHRNINKFTWTSPDGKTHNQIDHILIDSRRHSSALDIRSFRAADYDTDHYLVVANLGRGWQWVKKELWIVKISGGTVIACSAESYMEVINKSIHQSKFRL